MLCVFPVKAVSPYACSTVQCCTNTLKVLGCSACPACPASGLCCSQSNNSVIYHDIDWLTERQQHPPLRAGGGGNIFRGFPYSIGRVDWQKTEWNRWKDFALTCPTKIRKEKENEWAESVALALAEQRVFLLSFLLWILIFSLFEFALLLLETLQDEDEELVWGTVRINEWGGWKKGAI